MKKGMTKIITLMLAVIMTLSLTGFQKFSTKVRVKEPITLKVYSQQTFPAQFTSGIQTDEVSKEIERVTGVSIDLDAQPNDDKTKALIASCDIPDIFIANGNTIMDALIKSGSIIPLDNLVKSNGLDVKKVIGTALDYSKKNYSNKTGKLYFIPGRVSTKETYFSPVIGLFMRWDYYKELNFPKLKTVDDVVNVLAQMQKKHPTNAEGKKVYGFSPWTDWGQWHYTVLHDEMFGFSGYAGLSSGVVGYDRVNYAYVDRLNNDKSSLWQDSILYNKAYRKGLVDPDSLTQKYDEASAKMDSGRVLCQVAQWLTSNVNASLQKDGNKLAGYVSIPYEGARYSGGNFNPVGLASYWCISKNCKNPQKAMDLINYFISNEGSRTILDGVKGKYWTEANGKAKLTTAGLTVKTVENFMNTTGIRKYQNLTGIDQMAKDSKGQFIDLSLEPDVLATTLSPLTKDWLGHYGVKSEDSLWHKYGGFAANTAFGALLPTASNDIKRVDAKIDSYLRTNIPKLWMAKDDAEFNSVKATIREGIKKMPDYDLLVKFAKKGILDAKTRVQAFK